jgi:lysozyme
MTLEGEKLLIEEEGCKLEIYKDAVGLDTIGVGHLLSLSDKESGRFRDGITKEQAIALLHADMAPREAQLKKLVQVPLTPHQADALLSFAFNVGLGAFAGSTLLALLNRGVYGEVTTEMRKWNKAGGRIVQGLANRREKECRLWSMD